MGASAIAYRLHSTPPHGFFPLLAGWVSAFCLGMLFLNKSYPNYLIPTLFPACLLVAYERSEKLLWIWWIGILAASLEPQLRFDWIGGELIPLRLWLAELAQRRELWKALAFGAVELALVGCLFALTRQGLRVLSGKP